MTPQQEYRGAEDFLRRHEAHGGLTYAVGRPSPDTYVTVTLHCSCGAVSAAPMRAAEAANIVWPEIVRRAAARSEPS